MLNNKFFIGCMFITSLLASCKKSDTYNIKGEEAVKFFTNNESLGNAPINSISYAVVNIPDIAGSGIVNLSTTIPATIKFPVFATKPVGQSVIISAELDNTLIAAYNAANNTNYEAFPAGVLASAAGLKATIPQGATKSSDSISIAADLTKLNTFTGKSYMAPVKLTTVSVPGAGEVTANSSTKISYIVVDVEYRRIKYLATTTDVLGALIPRTSWTLLFTPVATSISGTGSVTDGSTTSYSRWSGSPVQVDVNMQTAQNVTGVRLYTTNSATNIPTQVEVSLSTDGINYDVIGAPLRANLTYASSYNYILFYKPVSAKYLRLKVYYSTSTSTNNFRIAEIDVYAN